MEIQVNYDYRQGDVEELFDIEQLAQLVLSEEGASNNSEVAITFVENDAIRKLNATYRSIDAPTDVLSFECDGYQTDGLVAEAPEGMPYELGDIFVAVDVAEGQAPGFGLSLAEEVSLLVVHGLLHLLGHDHLEEAEAQEMEAREVALLTKFWGTPFSRSRAEE